jgi:hypothetical protein
MLFHAVSLRAGTKSHRKEVNRGMLKELQKFSADERGQSDLIVAIVVAVIVVLAVIVFYRGGIIPALQTVVNKIVACLQCALTSSCTSC